MNNLIKIQLFIILSLELSYEDLTVTWPLSDLHTTVER